MGHAADAYKALLKALMPPGRAFTRAPGSVIDEFMDGASQELARLDARVDTLIAEDRVAQSTELLDAHLLDVGLPDACNDLDGATTAQKRAAALARLIAVGGLNEQYYIDRALELGYTITITEYTPAWCGDAVAGDPCGDQHVLFYWKVHWLYDVTAPKDGKDLACFLEKRKPAHTIIITEPYGPGFSNGFSSGFDSLPIPSPLTGGFTSGFSDGFEVSLAGGFDYDAFSDGFSKPK